MTARRTSSAPLRVMALGSSTVVETSWHGGPRTDLAYPRVLEAELLAAGVPVAVEVHARASNRIWHGWRDWDKFGPRWSPDVVILHLGHAEPVHLFLPRWLERHGNSPVQRPGAVRRLYRRRVVRPVWITLAKLQVRVDARVGRVFLGRREPRHAAELLDLIGHVRATSDALVLVPDLMRPGPPWAKWFPGAAARMELFNRLVSDAIDALGDERVQRFPLVDVVLGGLPPGEEPTPDGGHFTPGAHRLIGTALADVVLAHRPIEPITER